MEENRDLDVEETVETKEEVLEETVEENLEEKVEETTEENELFGFKKLKDENKKLNNEIEALKDRLLRITAEYENYRKRTAKEKEGIYTDACADVLKEIIPSMDNLERAISVEGSSEDIKKGIEMTMKGFQGALEKLGVEEIDTDNGFDPNYHNAVMHINDETLEKNVVAEVFLKGYKKNDKVIRHSMVKVAN